MSRISRPWPMMTLSYRWSQQRQAFGKPLSSQAVIRSKLAQMIARVESAQGWLENVTHQMNNVRPHLPFSFYRFGQFPNNFLPVASIDVIRRAVGEDRWNDRSPQAVSPSLTFCRTVTEFFWLQVCHVHRACYRRRRRTNIWWTIHHPDWHGQVGRERASLVHTIHFRCTKWYFFRYSTIVRRRTMRSWVVQRMLWAILVYDRR